MKEAKINLVIENGKIVEMGIKNPHGQYSVLCRHPETLDKKSVLEVMEEILNDLNIK